jgi:hypothetical protein
MRPLPARILLSAIAISALTAGAHVFFAGEGGASMHLKIAQPRDLRVGSGSVIITAARYVQWNGQKIAGTATAPAVSITLQ